MCSERFFVVVSCDNESRREDRLLLKFEGSASRSLTDYLIFLFFRVKWERQVEAKSGKKLLSFNE